MNSSSQLHHHRRSGVPLVKAAFPVLDDPEKPSTDTNDSKSWKARHQRWRWISWTRDYARQPLVKALLATVIVVLASLRYGFPENPNSQLEQQQQQQQQQPPPSSTGRQAPISTGRQAAPPSSTGREIIRDVNDMKPEKRALTSALERRPPTLDFIVAGFPKAGTTTLLFSLSKHPEVLMEGIENCQIARPLQNDDANLNRLSHDLEALKRKGLRRQQSSERSVLGIKCPDALKNFKAIHRLSQHSPNCKFVIGLRHPIWHLQSFYNYRVVESYKKNTTQEIPTLHSIFDQNLNWWDVSPDSTRFDLFLGQFGKTAFSSHQLQEMFLDRPMLAVKPNRFPIFMYTLDQIQSEKQSDVLRKDLQHFLGLTKPLEPFGHMNRVHKVAQQYKGSINICDVEFDNIRKTILHRAQSTAQWILQEFLQSPNVTVSDRPAFVQYVQSWTIDPCQANKSTE